MQEISKERAASTEVGESGHFLIRKGGRLYLGSEKEWKEHTLTPIDEAITKKDPHSETSEPLATT